MSYMKMCKTFKVVIFRYFSRNWYKYTTDTHILDIVTNGLKLELNKLPCQYSRSNHPLSAKENEVISTEIKKLLKKKVIVYSTTEYNEFISGILTMNKKDGSKRISLRNSGAKYVSNKMLRQFQNFPVCLGNTSAEKLPRTQQKPLHIVLAIASEYFSILQEL